MGWRWLTAAEVISHNPCNLKGILVTPSAASAECKFYNGESDQDPIAFEVFLTTQDTLPVNFPDGLKLDRGLYVGALTNVTGVLVIWEPLP